jgi:TM2 domain-containing membrane protein YozV
MNDAGQGPLPSPGWYPDPERAGGMRYWNGEAWTEHRQAPAGPAPAPGPAAGPGPWSAPGGPVGAADDQWWIAVTGQEMGPYTSGQLASMAVAKQVTATTQVRGASGGWFPLGQLPGVFSDKDWTTALILSVLVGSLGVDQFYLGNVGLGLAKLFTCGGLGIWTIIDIVRIATNSVPDSLGRPLRK